MKINLSTPPLKVIETIQKEWQMAYDAYENHHGGKDAHDKWQDEMLKRLDVVKHSFIGDKFLWTSPDGNKWCAFEHCEYADGLTHTCAFLFCYYETLPFAGIFFGCTNQNATTGKKEYGVVVYESHFFERCDERGIYKWNGIDTLIDFIKGNPSASAFSVDLENCRIDLRFDKCIGRGFFDKKLGTRFIRIKTILKDESLTKRQSKQTMQGRAWGDACNKYMSPNKEFNTAKLQMKAFRAMQNGKGEEFADEMVRDMARMIQIPQEEARRIYEVNIAVTSILIGICPSLIRHIMEKPIGDVIIPEIVKMLNDWDDTADDASCQRQLVGIVIKAAKACGRTLSKSAVLRYIYKQRMKASNGKD